MINGIGKSGPGRIDAQRLGLGHAAGQIAGQVAGVATTGAAAPVGGIDGVGGMGGARAGGLLSELLADGAPVDGGKVAQVRAAIAEGRYTVDPDLIADRMISADLGR